MWPPVYGQGQATSGPQLPWEPLLWHKPLAPSTLDITPLGGPDWRVGDSHALELHGAGPSDRGGQGHSDILLGRRQLPWLDDSPGTTPPRGL